MENLLNDHEDHPNQNKNSHKLCGETEHSVVNLKKTNFMASFYGWGSTALRLLPLRGCSLLFTSKFLDIPRTHFIDLVRMKGWSKVIGNWDNKIRISQLRESHCRTNTSVRRKKWIQKGRTMGITVWNPSRKVNHLSKIIWDRKTITEFTRSISSTKIGEPVFMMDVKISKDKNISRWIDRENLIYVRWIRIKNRAQSWRRWSREENSIGE